MDSLKAAATSSLQLYKTWLNCEKVSSASNWQTADKIIQTFSGVSKGLNPQQKHLQLPETETNTWVMCTLTHTHSQTHTFKLVRNSMATSHVSSEALLPGYAW